MDMRSVCIKIKHLNGMNALNANGLMGLKMNGGNILMLKELEMKGGMMGKGLMMKELEMEGGRRMIMLQPSPNVMANEGAVAKSAVAKSTVAKSAVAKSAVARSAVAKSAIAKSALGANSALVANSAIAGSSTLAASSALAASNTVGATSNLGANGALAAQSAWGAKGALVMNGVAAKGVVVPGALSASALGWGLGLAGLSAWVAVASAGLAVAGVYFYVRGLHMASVRHDLTDPQSAA
jgi:hypothetical protein